MVGTFANNALGQITSAISAATTLIPLQSGQGALFPSPTNGDYFYAVIYNSTEFEIVKVTGVATDTLTVVRAQQGTLAQSFNIGDTLEQRLTAGDLDNFVQTDSGLYQPAGSYQPAGNYAKLAGDNTQVFEVANSTAGTQEAIPRDQADALYNLNLGFTPIQQGGGAGQGTNKVYIGWDGTTSRLKVQVDITDEGSIVLDTQLNALISSGTVYNAGHLQTTAGVSTWNYSAQGGTPTYLWGTNDGVNMEVWNPNNISVNYATTAGTANSVSNVPNTFGAIGTYVLAAFGGSLAAGGTVSGTGLTPIDTSGGASGATLLGTWKAMGYNQGGSGVGTLFLRIS